MSGMDSENHLLTGRPFGGIGILWKKSISKFVKAITFDDSRLLGVQITDNQETFVLLMYTCHSSVKITMKTI